MGWVGWWWVAKAMAGRCKRETSDWRVRLGFQAKSGPSRPALPSWHPTRKAPDPPAAHFRTTKNPWQHDSFCWIMRSCYTRRQIGCLQVQFIMKFYSLDLPTGDVWKRARNDNTQYDW